MAATSGVTHVTPTSLCVQPEPAVSGAPASVITNEPEGSAPTESWFASPEAATTRKKEPSTVTVAALAGDVSVKRIALATAMVLRISAGARSRPRSTARPRCHPGRSRRRLGRRRRRRSPRRPRRARGPARPLSRSPPPRCAWRSAHAARRGRRPGRPEAATARSGCGRLPSPRSPRDPASARPPEARAHPNRSPPPPPGPPPRARAPTPPSLARPRAPPPPLAARRSHPLRRLPQLEAVSLRVHGPAEAADALLLLRLRGDLSPGSAQPLQDCVQ